jgi:putative aldouronate transport system substrate-binding protein
MFANTFTRGLLMGLLLIILVACAQATPTSAPKPAPTTAPQVAPTTAATKPAATIAPTAVPGPQVLTLPIVKEPMSISYWAAMNTAPAAVLKSYGEMGAYKELEKRTGIKIEFQHPPTGQGTEQFNLIVASGKYPDVIETNWLSASGGPGKYLKDGVIIRLNDSIDKYAPNLTRLFKEHPDWKRMIQTDEGDIYCFPFIRSDPIQVTFTGPVLRKDWLDKLNLKTPTTIDEWYVVLKAFKEKDPNGNGKADEVPFNPYVSPDSANAYRGAFNNYAFISAWGIGANFYQEKGVVKYGPLQPEFKEFLKVMAQWAKEGLIDPDFYSTKKSVFDAKVTGNQLGSAVMLSGGGIGTYIPLMAKDPTFKLVAAPYPVLKAGDKPVMSQRDNTYPGEGCAAITTANKRVVETVKLLDYAYSPEGHLLFNFGIEGVSYKMENGYPKYTDEVIKNPKNLPMSQAMALYMRANFNGPFVQDPRYNEQFSALPEQQDALKTWRNATNERHLPPITQTQDESKKYSTIMTDINTLYDETFSKILSGQMPVDKWDDFVKQIKAMGIEDAIKLRQAALDRYNKRP